LIVTCAKIFTTETISFPNKQHNDAISPLETFQDLWLKHLDIAYFGLAPSRSRCFQVIDSQGHIDVMDDIDRSLDFNMQKTIKLQGSPFRRYPNQTYFFNSKPAHNHYNVKVFTATYWRSAQRRR
jgi:hypothetical protein